MSTSHPPKASARQAVPRVVKPGSSKPKKLMAIWGVRTESFHSKSAAATKAFAGYTALYDMQPVERAELVKRRAPSRIISSISKDMDMSRDRFVSIIGLPRGTIARRISQNEDLSVDESERLVGLAKLIGQVETIVKQSGNPEGFKPAKWFSEWIEQPVAALGGRKPEDLLDTSDGREAVSRLLAQMQSGVYA
jgi:putative toxin-antitoxin system antitoxin component (TIGR02293 family)